MRAARSVAWWRARSGSGDVIRRCVRGAHVRPVGLGDLERGRRRALRSTLERGPLPDVCVHPFNDVLGEASQMGRPRAGLPQGAAGAATWEDLRMIIERSLNEQFLSNTYLVADGEGGPGFFIDAGGPVAPLIEAAKRLRIEPTHVLLTHHHFDHVSELGVLRKRWPKLEVLIHALERDPLAEMGEVLGKGAEIGTIEAGQTLQFGLL